TASAFDLLPGGADLLTRGLDLVARGLQLALGGLHPRARLVHLLPGDQARILVLDRLETVVGNQLQVRVRLRLLLRALDGAERGLRRLELLLPARYLRLRPALLLHRLLGLCVGLPRQRLKPGN